MTESHQSAAYGRPSPAAPWLEPERMAERGDKPMRGPELAEEAAWLWESGAYSPDELADALGTTVTALRKVAQRAGRRDLARALSGGNILATVDRNSPLSA